MEHDGGYGNARAILEECRKANVALDQLDKQLDNLKSLFLQVPARPNMPSNEINTLSSQIMTGYRVLVSGVKRIKSNPESGSPRTAPQVGLLDGRLKAAIQRYQTLKTGFRTDSQQAAKRQYRIVRPDATDAEVWEAVLDPAEPIFIQAFHSSDSHSKANATLRDVRERHDAIQNIERQMIELAQISRDLDEIVQREEPLVAGIDQKGETVRENVTKGNEEIGTAIVSVSARNRKKWWCLLVCILIAILIAIIVTVVAVIIKNKKP